MKRHSMIRRICGQIRGLTLIMDRLGFSFCGILDKKGQLLLPLRSNMDRVGLADVLWWTN